MKAKEAKSAETIIAIRILFCCHKSAEQYENKKANRKELKEIDMLLFHHHRRYRPHMLS